VDALAAFLVEASTTQERPNTCIRTDRSSQEVESDPMLVDHLERQLEQRTGSGHPER
jgi:hypothetical protein